MSEETSKIMMGEEDEEAAPADGPRVLAIKGEPVMLASDIARVLGVETREIRQAIRRNPTKFTQAHAFRASADDVEFLRSQNVITGKGWAPTLLTQKGFVRLLTVLNAPKAIEATDQIIDLFLTVFHQIRDGRTTAVIANPSQLAPADDVVDDLRKLRRRIVKAMSDLLDTTIDTKTQTTVADILGETATGLQSQWNAWLKSPQIKNEQIAADTLKVLEQTRDIYERRQADLKKSRAETEKIVLENIKTKIDLVAKLLGMADKLEPGALAMVLPHFSDACSLLPAPAKPSSERTVRT
jgi:hypothetical protein